MFVDTEDMYACPSHHLTSVARLRRLPWAQVQQLEAVGKHGIAVASSMVTKMKVPNAASHLSHAMQLVCLWSIVL